MMTHASATPATQSPLLAIIGGSGLNQLSILEDASRQFVRTPFGEPSCPLTLGSICGHPMVFLARHGHGHTIMPADINYRANIYALQSMAVTGIIAVGSVGSIHPAMTPGDLVIPDQVIDYTWGRAPTFHGALPDVEMHTDFTHPFSSEIRSRLLDVADLLGFQVHDGGVYACTQGPRLETAAEIRRLAGDGADVVGMTAMPEAILARELKIPYAQLNVVVNYAAGIGESAQGIEFSALGDVMELAMCKVRLLIETLVGCKLPG
jgi:5'-deoxy-5'-methylthioadenosine phosphorylase